MDCQCCQKKPAHIRVCDIDDNVMSEQFNICADCWIFVKRYLFDQERHLAPTREVLHEVRQLISSKESTALAVAEAPGGLATTGKPAEVPVCPDCGMTLAEFKAKGRFGCPRDYEVFHAHLDPLLERIHDTTPPRHKGRVPAAGESDDSLVRQRQQVARLKDQLQAAVTQENYEQAARLRDQINALENAVDAGKAAPGGTA